MPAPLPAPTTRASLALHHNPLPRAPQCKSPKSRFKVYKGVVKGKVNNSGGEMKKRFAAKQW